MSYFELPEPRRERCPFCDNVDGPGHRKGALRCAVVLRDRSDADVRRAPMRQHLGQAAGDQQASRADPARPYGRGSRGDHAGHASGGAGCDQGLYEPDGMTIYQNNGVASGQEIPHVHMHVVPRYHDDGGPIPDKGPFIPYDERAEVAARVKRSFE